MANHALIRWKLPTNGRRFQSILNKLSSQAGIARIDAKSEYPSRQMFIEKVPILDDVSVEVASDFTDASSVIPGGSLFESVFKVQNAAGGGTSKLQSMFDLQIWSKTNPIKINFDALFYVRNNPIKDVLRPVLALMSLTVLTDTGGGQFDTPGVSLSTLSAFTGKEPKKNAKGTGFKISKKAKILDIEIPGIVIIKQGLIKSAKPTWSKDITESGVPLWCKLNLEVESIFPATDVDLAAIASSRLNSARKKKSLKNQGSDKGIRRPGLSILG